MDQSGNQRWPESQGFVRSRLYDIDAFRDSPLELAARARGVAEGLVKGGGGDLRSMYRGKWRGHDVAIFEFIIVRKSLPSVSLGLGHGGLDASHRSEEPHICATIEVSADLPALSVQREGKLQRLAGGLGEDDLEVGSPDIDRELKISAADEALAREVLDVDLLEGLRSLPKNDCDGLEAGGRFLLAHRSGHHVEPRDQQLVELVADLRDRFGDSLLARYPLGSGVGPGSEEPW